MKNLGPNVPNFKKSSNEKSEEKGDPSFVIEDRKALSKLVKSQLKETLLKKSMSDV